MVQIEVQEVLKEKQVLDHKYEKAKRRLSEVMAELNENKKSEEYYQNHMIKFQHHVNKTQWESSEWEEETGRSCWENTRTGRAEVTNNSEAAWVWVNNKVT